ncbi:MAG: hypothetical protein K9G42_02750 [Pedobacter sp.]|nr:hypothetical protein [Pedobacter sp.]
MLKPLFLTALFLLSFKAKAQYIEYEPNPIPSSNSEEVGRRSSTPKIEFQTITAYQIEASTGSIKKYKIKVGAIQNRYRIIGYKELSSQYWSDFHPVNMPLAEKLNFYDKLSENFEYKAYIPSLGTTIYF